MLLLAGASPNCGNNAGRTALHSAVCNKQLGLVQILILEGAADPQARDLDGDTPRDAALSVFGADHDAVKAIDSFSLACKLRSCASEGIRCQVRDMKALLATAGACLHPPLHVQCATVFLCCLVSIFFHSKRLALCLPVSVSTDFTMLSCLYPCGSWQLCTRMHGEDHHGVLRFAGVAVVPGCERGELERQCQESLKGLPQRILAQDRTAEIVNVLIQARQDMCQSHAESADAFATDISNAAQASDGRSVGHDVTTKSEEERIVPVHAAVAKEKGNAAFSGGDFRRAIVHYTMALRVTDASTEDRTSSDAVSLFRAALFSNRSAAHASSAMWQQALHDAQEALKIDDQCAKYWCRKGAAQMGLGRLKDATCSYKQGLEVDGGSNAAQAGLEQARSGLQRDAVV